MPSFKKPPPPQPSPQIGETLSKELNRNCRLRQQMRLLIPPDQEKTRFSQRYWFLMGLYNELTHLLNSEMAQFKPCRQGHCRLQTQADTLTKLSYQYFVSVLDVFRAPQPTELSVSTQLADYLGLDHQDSETHYYLYAKEIAHLAALINEAIRAALATAAADYPEPSDTTAERLPVIFQLLRRYGYANLAKVPNKGFEPHHYQSDYWIRPHRFNLHELHLIPSDLKASDSQAGDSKASNHAVLTYRNSRRRWYCGHCLGRTFQHTCNLNGKTPTQ